MRNQVKSLLLALTCAGTLIACGGQSGTSGTGADAKQLQRADKTAASAASNYQNLLEQLYVAYYGRPADPAGMAYWEGVLQAANAPTNLADLNTAYSTTPAVKAIVDSFGNSAELLALYGSGNASGFINAIYQNILDRSTASDAAGAAYWSGLLASGTMTQAQAALAILSAAAGEPTTSSDEQVVANRLAVANYFTNQISNLNDNGVYSGATANSSARAMLTQVGSATDTAAFQTTVANTITTINNEEIFESTALSGGEATITENIPYGGGNLVPGINYIYSTSINSLTQSPSSGPQISSTYTTSLDNLLAPQSASNGRILLNGQIWLLSSLGQRRISYSGNHVQVDYLASDGSTALTSAQFYNYISVPLNGLMNNAPEELLASVPIDDWIKFNNFSANAKWQAGAAYTRKQGYRVGDYITALDCANVASPTYTSGTSLTPCQTNATLDNFFPISQVDSAGHPNETDFLSGGTISTVQGVRMWVASSPLPLAQSPSQTFRVYYEMNGNVYMGFLQKDGTPFAYEQADGSVVNYVITLNQAAVSSIQQGVITGSVTAGSQAGNAQTVNSTSDLFGIGGTGINGALAPADLRAHYNVPVNLDGTGQTIAIVDGPGTGDVADDLNAYSRYFNLPTCNSANPCFQHVDLSNGAKVSGANDNGMEVALDTQMVHAIAPGATIILVTAASMSGTDLYAAVNYAANLPGVTAVSMSFGGSGFMWTQETQFASFQARGSPIFFASSGDNGHTGSVQYPASSQYVTAVGGTRINAVQWTSPASETAWQYSGGGATAYESVPTWQLTWLGAAIAGANNSMRATPDVAAVADPQHSAIGIYYKDAWLLEGGTSASTPLWAGIGALLGQYLANQHSSLAQLVSGTPGGFNALLYKAAYSQSGNNNFYDIVAGSNNLNANSCTLCSATVGYDDVTGLGAPNVMALFLNLGR